MDDQGRLWLAYPRPINKTRHYFDTELPVELNGVQTKFRHNADHHPIDGTSTPWLFTSGVEGPVRLTILLSDNQKRKYDVQLLFAETGSADPGQRVFDVKIQQETRLSACDIASQAGGQNRASIHKFADIDAKGSMTIELVPVQGQPPRICSLVITEAEP